MSAKRLELADRLRSHLKGFPLEQRESFVSHATMLWALRGITAPVSRRDRLAILQETFKAAETFIDALGKCSRVLDADCEQPLSHAPWAVLAEKLGGVDQLLEKLNDPIWRPGNAVAASEHVAQKSVLQETWHSALIAASAMAQSIEVELAKAAPPRRGPQRTDAMLLGVARAYLRILGAKPSKYRDGLFYAIARELTNRVDPSRQVNAAIGALDRGG